METFNIRDQLHSIITIYEPYVGKRSQNKSSLIFDYVRKCNINPWPIRLPCCDLRIDGFLSDSCECLLKASSSIECS